MLEKKITFDSFVRGALTAAIVVALFWLLDHLSSVLLPFFIAWLVAYFMYPLVKFYQYRLRMKNRVIAILSAMLTVVIVLTLASIFFGAAKAGTSPQPISATKAWCWISAWRQTRKK